MKTIGILEAMQIPKEDTFRIAETFHRRDCDAHIINPAHIRYTLRNGRCHAVHDTVSMHSLGGVLVRSSRDNVCATWDAAYYLTRNRVPILDKLEAFANPLGKLPTLFRAAGQVKLPHTTVVLAGECAVPSDWDDWPVVLKPLDGYGGGGIQFVENKKHLEDVLASPAYSGTRVIIQQYIPFTEEYRVTVFGRSAVSVHRRSCSIPGQIAKNVQRGGEVELVQCEDLHDSAVAAAAMNQYSIAGVDYGVSDGHAYLLEVNRNPGLLALKCPKFDPLDELASFLVQQWESADGT